MTHVNSDHAGVQAEGTVASSAEVGTIAAELKAGVLTDKAADRRWMIWLVVAAVVVAGAYVLLWSPWWYPLSDSSLFIALARNLDEGRGYTYMGRPHRMVMPLTPALLWGLMQFSRSFGLMNGAMIGCMLGSFVFMYLALKEWMDRRAALGLTVVSALTYWQFRLATVIMSEQPFVLVFWMGLYFLALGRRRPERRAVWLMLAAGAFFVGVGFRLAGGLMIPVIAIGVWLEYRDRMPRWRRTALAAAIVLPMVVAVGAYDLSQIGKGGRKPREFVPLPKRAPAATSQEADEQTSQIVRYIPRARILMAGVCRFPGVLGRWLCESLVAPSREALKRLGSMWEALLAGLIGVVALVGVWQQLRERNWWLLVPILYVLAFVALWGTRYIPRYLVPVMPMVLLWLSTGTGAILARGASWLGMRELSGNLRRIGMIAVPVAVLLCNLPLLVAEIYAGHKGSFYATIRQGATAELVDAAAYIRKQLPQETVICTNDYARRREVHLLTGRGVAMYRGVRIIGPEDEQSVRRFFVRTGARCALIRYLGVAYPEWHFGLTRGARKAASWWGLYIWDEEQEKPVRIVPAEDRGWLREVPDSAI